MAGMDAITIRPARPADAGAIARLDVDTWRTTYAGVLSTDYLVGLSPRRREIGWRMAIQRDPLDIRVAVDGADAVRGFGSCGPSRSERRFPGEVFTLYVAPDWQDRGIGRRLLTALFRRLTATGGRDRGGRAERPAPPFRYEFRHRDLTSRPCAGLGAAGKRCRGFGARRRDPLCRQRISHGGLWPRRNAGRRGRGFRS